MCEYAGRIKLHVVNFTHVQEEIRDKCPEEYFTIIMRRYMMRLPSVWPGKTAAVPDHR